MFDPLHKWLGIPPDQQPPDHYRLLGITRFESDVDVIHAAADKQLAFLHDLTNGPEADAAEELSNQVSAARVILVNTSKREAYDLQLKGASDSSPSVATAVSPPPSPPPVPVSAAGPSAVAYTAVDTTIDWHLRHGDKVVHGPFEFQHLIEAARTGNIAADTEIQHAAATHGQWVTAITIPEIAQQYSIAAADTKKGSDSVVVVPRRRTQARHFRWQSVVAHIFSMIVFFILPAYLLYRNPRVREIMHRAVTGTEVTPPKPVTVIQEPPAAPPRPVIPAGHQTNHEVPSQPPVQHPTVQQPQEPTFAEQAHDRGRTLSVVEDVVDEPQEKLLNLKLDLDSITWIAPLEDSFKSGQYYITTVTGSPGTIEVRPSSGELSTDRPTHLAFDETSGLAIELKIADVGNPPVRSLTGKWVCQMDGQSVAEFSLARLRNREKFLAKQRTAVATMQALTNEKAQLQQFLNRKGLKQLEAVNAAKKRIKFIDSQMGPLKQRAQQEQEFLEQFMAFKERVYQIHQSAELVVRNIER